MLIDYTREELEEVREATNELLTHGPKLTTTGICYNLLKILPESNVSFYELVPQLAASWPLCSNNPEFPIENEDEYLDTRADVWAGRSGMLRRKLCEHIIQRLDNYLQTLGMLDTYPVEEIQDFRHGMINLITNGPSTHYCGICYNLMSYSIIDPYEVINELAEEWALLNGGSLDQPVKDEIIPPFTYCASENKWKGVNEEKRIDLCRYLVRFLTNYLERRK